MSKSVSGYNKTKKKKRKKKWHGPLSHWCREGKTLVVQPLKKPLLYVCLPLFRPVHIYVYIYIFSLCSFPVNFCLVVGGVTPPYTLSGPTTKKNTFLCVSSLRVSGPLLIFNVYNICFGGYQKEIKCVCKHLVKYLHTKCRTVRTDSTPFPNPR